MSKIQHLIVLMLENRSFDHMLGFLQYPPGTEFEGVRGRESTMPNPLPGGGEAFPGPDAPFALDVGPGHSHDDVLQQLLGTNDRSRPWQLTNDGFAANYDTNYSPGNGRLALQCFPPEKLPVLSGLAQEFAVCDHWFCSVPGATWPNRNFCHAGTSNGEVNITVQAYHNRTIFQQLAAGDRDWAVYYGGFPPQSLAFTDLWSPFKLHWLQRYKPIEQLYRAIGHDRLPHYAFVEPDMMGKLSDSQHPGMGGEMDFRAGERLIWRIYDALRQNPAVFEKTLFLITYDEHGGFFDHVPPPASDEFTVDEIYEEPDTGYRFPFDLLGLRVPAVLVSPWIERGTVDTTVYDHTSIAATLGKLFDLDLAPLGRRVQNINTFEAILSRDTPRADLPALEEPFVDESARQMVEEPDLRPSLIATATTLVWDELRPQARDLAPLGAAEGEPVPGLEMSPDEAEEAVLDEIAPQLSPEAQETLAEASPEVAGLRGLGSVADTFKGFAERLANSGLVDDLGLFADRVLHRFFDSHKTILRTTAGLSVQEPGAADLGQALDEVFAQSEAAARIWLTDHQDRWLTIYADGRATLDDQDPDRTLALAHVSRQRALELLALLQAGEIRDLRRAFS
jgi:phospholipase C